MRREIRLASHNSWARRRLKHVSWWSQWIFSCVHLNQRMAVSYEISRADRCLFGLSSWLSTRSCTHCYALNAVYQRILRKLGVTVHRCLQGKAPQYLVNCCHPTSDVASRQRLRSSSRHHLVVVHDIVAARSAVGRSPSPVRWPGMRCLTTSETRRSVPTISGKR